MMKDTIAMTEKERKRYHLLKMVVERGLSLVEAAERMGVCYRHAKRLKAEFVCRGAAGLVHGNRGRASPRRLPEDLAEQIRALSRGQYAGFNDTHFTEKLREAGIEVSRETVRRLRRAQDQAPKRKRRPRRHFRRRPRRAQEGMLVLWDGSPHRWFGPQADPCCLMAAIDDATGRVLEAFFVAFEGTWGYLRLLRSLVGRYGIPAAIYQDCHSCLRRNDDHWTLEEERAGQQNPTQVGLAQKALEIETIFALTPQAKGRVERLFGTLQDRWVPELILAGVTTLEDANTLLAQRLLEDYNRRFARTPQQTQPAWRTAPRGLDPDRIISFRYEATVAQDNTVQLHNHIIDIPPGPRQRGYAKAHVEVRQLLDGSWRVYYQDRLIAQTQPTPLLEPVRAKPRRKPSAASVFMASAPGTPTRGQIHSAAKGTY
jgi:transposase